MSLIEQLQTLDDDTLVLASTERVSRYLKMQAALLQSVAGKKSWFAKGKICTVSQWIESVWMDRLPNEQLLFPVQELAVVKSVADRSGLLPENLISSTSTARRIAQAYSTFIKFKLPDDPDRFKFKREYEVFWQWRSLIEDECRNTGCVFRAELPALVADAIENSEVPLPKKLVLVGVLYLNPSELLVIDLLRDRGVEIVVVELDDEQTVPQLCRSVNQTDEFEHVAKWVNDTLNPYAETPHAAPTMAILVPDMQSYQAPLIDALTISVTPASLVPSTEGGEVREPWDVSSGATLGARPMMRAAMGILTIITRDVDIDTFSRVLRSEWVGGYQEEGAQRALVDVWLRENNGMHMGAKDYLRALTASKKQCVIFTENFRRVVEKLEKGEASRYPSEWAVFIEESLVGMGWPNSDGLSSANYQTLEAWQKALAVFRSLDYQLGPCVYERAYMWLREILETTQFQPRLSHVAPVAIMTYADAVGLQFDHVWLLGASNKVLPMPADPNPFLPIDLVEAAGVPEATSEGQLAKAQRLVKALMSTSGSIHVSCAEHDERGATIGASELFNKWPAAVQCVSEPMEFTGNKVGTLNRDDYEAEQAPEVSETEAENLRGGVSVFKNFATEPFYAFACNRLGATAFPEPVIGFDPRIQGTMLHLCLEKFWRAVVSQEALKAMSKAELSTQVSDAVEKASIDLLYKLQWRYGRRMIALEQARLKGLMLQWLQVEAERVLPFVVVGFEQRTEVDVFGVQLTVTLDRIDHVTLPSGEVKALLFDYKSGANFTFNSLNADRLKEPQLPIYAIKVDAAALGIAAIEGITLAQVNAKAMNLHTRSSFSGHLDGSVNGKNDVCTPSEWAAQVTAWELALSAMAEGFLAGNADVSNYDKPIAVGYEHLAVLI